MTVSIFALAAAAAAQAAAPQVDPAQAQAQGYAQGQAAVGAQAPAGQPAFVTSVATQANIARFLPAGTQVSLTPTQELSSKHIKEGEHYKFTVVNDVTDNGVIVIPRGSIADGEITKQTGRGMGGKSGKFDVTFENVSANGVTFPLMGVHRQEGKGNTVGALLGSIWISGHSAVMLPGQVVTAMIKDRTAY